MFKKNSLVLTKKNQFLLKNLMVKLSFVLCKCLSNISMVPWAIWATASSVALLKVLTAAVSIAAIIENAKFQNTSFAEKRNFERKLHKYVTKSYFTQGPLDIWTEHSICQLHSRGDSKTLIALLIPNIFLIFLWNYFSMHIKAEGMTLFDIFYVFVENSVNSEFCFF